MPTTKNGLIELKCIDKNEYFFLLLLANSNKMNFSYQEKEDFSVLEEVVTEDQKDLVVYNDDFNTFEHVINTLIKVCKHSAEQAEQCTWIIHYRGKCAVKKGTFDELRPMKESICEAGIEAKIH